MYEYYIWCFVGIIVCAIISVIASVKVRTTFARYDKKQSQFGYTGRQTAQRLMQSGGADDIAVGRVSDSLTDHYDPTRKIVNLSASTYDSSSVAAVAVAAHEVGHVMQKKKGYLFYNIRTALVPLVNFGTRLAMPLVIIGLLIDMLSLSANEDLGFVIALIGVALYGASFLFALVTLPVELNASRRAKKMLLSEGILTQSEVSGASQVLSAAAFTYVASLLTSLVYFLRFLLRVLILFGRRRD